MATNDRDLQEIGKSAYECIAEMVAALEVDYDRLGELKDARDAWEPDEHDGQAWTDANPDDAEELKELTEAAGDCKSLEDAEQRITEDPLSVQVRGGWHSPGEKDGAKAEEFEILLSTGGPATRIMGELDEYGQPDRAWLEVQDWGTPWTQYFGADGDVLFTYARQFYFGE